MSGSESDTARTTTARLRPATAAQLLDHEQALAIQRITGSVQRLGDDLCAGADLRASIRRHPFLAAGCSVFLGVVGGPFIPRAFRQLWTTASSLVLWRVAGGRKVL